MYHILYVDDEPGLLEIGKIFLEQDKDITVETQTSAIPALPLLDSRTHDAVISDYQMPDMDGITFLKKVRASGNHIPFILFTGKGREEVVIQALNEGADFYLQKGGDPVSQFAELANKIRYAINTKRAEAALRESEERLRLFIRQAPVALAMFDSSMHYLAASRRWMADYHLGDRDLIGHSHYEIFPELTKEIKGVISRALAGEVSSANEDAFVRQDGSVQWL